VILWVLFYRIGIVVRLIYYLNVGEFYKISRICSVVVHSTIQSHKIHTVIAWKISSFHQTDFWLQIIDYTNARFGAMDRDRLSVLFAGTWYLLGGTPCTRQEVPGAGFLAKKAAVPGYRYRYRLMSKSIGGGA
jgi:hypothetical protein